MAAAASATSPPSRKLSGLWRRGLYAVASILGAGLLFLVGGRLMLEVLEKQLIYFPSRIARDAPAPRIPSAMVVEEVWLATADGHRIHAIHATREGSFAELLFFHGNAGSLYDRADNVDGLVRSGFNVLILDYRGFGKSDGTPTEAGLYHDAVAAYDYLTQTREVDPGRLVLFGRSLGAAVAVELGTRDSMGAVGAVIVESGFTAAGQMARLHYAWIPGFVINAMTHKMDSLSKVERLRAPALFVHGSDDTIVPTQMGRRLFEASGEPKEWYEIARAGHNDTWLVGGAAYYRRLADFAKKHVGGEGSQKSSNEPGVT